MAAMPNMIDDTNKNNLERLRLLSRQAIFSNQGKFSLLLAARIAILDFGF